MRAIVTGDAGSIGTVRFQVTIAHNRIRNDQFGIWLGVGDHVNATLQHNVFHDAATQVFTSS